MYICRLIVASLQGYKAGGGEGEGRYPAGGEAREVG